MRACHWPGSGARPGGAFGCSDRMGAAMTPAATNSYACNARYLDVASLPLARMGPAARVGVRLAPSDAQPLQRLPLRTAPTLAVFLTCARRPQDEPVPFIQSDALGRSMWRIAEYVIRDFVQSWYVKISDDKVRLPPRTRALSHIRPAYIEHAYRAANATAPARALRTSPMTCATPWTSCSRKSCARWARWTGRSSSRSTSSPRCATCSRSCAPRSRSCWRNSRTSARSTRRGA
jgi:hypothetical protein